MICTQKVGDLGYYQTPEFDGEEANIRWGGKGVQLLGLPDEYDPVMFERILHGRNPHDGSKLTARLSGNRRKGWDITTTHEKAVSGLELVAGDERIGKLRDDANEYAMSRIEKQIATRVRRGGKDDDRTTGVMIYASVSHTTNRLGEPHGHHHNIVANLTYDKVERQWKAVQLGLVDYARISHDYHRFMVKGLRQLGYKVKFYGNRYDIQGIPDVADRFSTRHAQIKGKEAAMDASARAKGTRGMGAKARAKLSLYDRPPKVGDGSREDMHKDWLSQLDDFETHGLRNAVRKARATVKRRGWADQSRAAFDRMRGFEREDHAIELGRGR